MSDRREDGDDLTPPFGRLTPTQQPSPTIELMRHQLVVLTERIAAMQGQLDKARATITTQSVQIEMLTTAVAELDGRVNMMLRERTR